METATKILRKANTEAVSPMILKFAEATVEKIESDVIPAIHEEHEISVKLLQDEYAKFTHVLTEVQQRGGELTTLDAEVSTYSQSHTECRHTEHTITEEWQECETKRESYMSTITSYEESLTISEGDIDDLWCRNVFDPLSDHFFESNKQILQTYMTRYERIEKEWREYESVECVNKVTEKTEQTERCDETQTTLEEYSCKRANLLEELKEHFTTEWHTLTTSYNIVVNTTVHEEQNRKEEFVGLHIVKCLLNQVIEIAQIDGPCDETHFEKVTAEVKRCHEETVETTILDIHVDPVPELPDPLYEHAPFPCEADYLALHYANLPVAAAARQCQNTHCSAKVRGENDVVIEERPLATR